MPTPPDFPFTPPPEAAFGTPDDLLETLAAQPDRTRDAAFALADAAKLDEPYRNWSARQIVHHLAHSHLNAYARFRLALTEDRPQIRPYDEAAWVALPDAQAGAIETPLALLAALHQSWVTLARTLDDAAWLREYVNPEGETSMSLAQALAMYVWHGRHHTAQLEWIAANR